MPRVPILRLFFYETRRNCFILGGFRVSPHCDIGAESFLIYSTSMRENLFIGEKHPCAHSFDVQPSSGHAALQLGHCSFTDTWFLRNLRKAGG